MTIHYHGTPITPRDNVQSVCDRARVAALMLQKAIRGREEWNEAHYCMVLDVLAAVSALSETEREREQRARSDASTAPGVPDGSPETE